MLPSRAPLVDDRRLVGHVFEKGDLQQSQDLLNAVWILEFGLLEFDSQFSIALFHAFKFEDDFEELSFDHS